MISRQPWFMDKSCELQELSMFRIHSAHWQLSRQAAQRSRKPVGSSKDFSVRAYQHINADRFRAFFPNAARALGRIVGRFIRHALEAMHESRRQQAMAMLRRYGHLIDAEDQAWSPVSQEAVHAREGNDVFLRTGGFVDQAVHGMRIRCSITGAPCEGDSAHLCVEWGCARKGGISPISHENY